MRKDLKKILRFIRIYGFKRSLFKIFGRKRNQNLIKLFKCKVNCRIAVIGCGQFSFSTIGGILTKNFRSPFIDCYDICTNQLFTFAQFFNIQTPSLNFNSLKNNSNVKLVYITSNHASHSKYAVDLLNANIDVYIEKPVAVCFEQLALLNTTIKNSKNNVYCGYNRPFSKAVKTLKKYCDDLKGPITLSCFITGHFIEKDHWYRNPNEGTRVCGNLGHWLDLAVHILGWKHLPDTLKIMINYSDSYVNDDNINVSLTSERGDLIVITLTSRSEPFEGINETINFQQDQVISKIDDFRNVSIWKNDLLVKESYQHKDVGHRDAIMQPFEKSKYRTWDEILNSSLLTLAISEMVKSRQEISNFSFSKCFRDMCKLKISQNL